MTHSIVVHSLVLGSWADPARLTWETATKRLPHLTRIFSNISAKTVADILDLDPQNAGCPGAFRFRSPSGSLQPNSQERLFFFDLAIWTTINWKHVSTQNTPKRNLCLTLSITWHQENTCWRVEVFDKRRFVDPCCCQKSGSDHNVHWSKQKCLNCTKYDFYLKFSCWNAWHEMFDG